MFVSDRIQEAIEDLGPNEIFVTRQFLAMGTRGSIDQILYMLVRRKKIIRLVRGVFVKAGAAMPEIWQIAKVKAESFGKRLLDHGIVAAKKLGMTSDSNYDNRFATNGRSSAFWFNGMRVHLVSVSPRKLHLNDSLPGSVIRALWHLGKSENTELVAAKTNVRWNPARRELLDAAPLLPAWMTNIVRRSA